MTYLRPVPTEAQRLYNGQVRSAARHCVRTLDWSSYSDWPIADAPITDIYDALRDVAYELLIDPNLYGLDVEDDLIEVTEAAVSIVTCGR